MASGVRQVKRAHVVSSGDGGGPIYDPRLLLFEFSTGYVLRPPQVLAPSPYSLAVDSGASPRLAMARFLFPVQYPWIGSKLCRLSACSRALQVALVGKLSTDAQANTSVCHQMLMGEGKTTVISPLLACAQRPPPASASRGPSRVALACCAALRTLLCR